MAPLIARAGEVRPEDSWHEARLLSPTGIRGQEEQEKRATSSLLAVMRAVPEFGHSLLSDLGAPRGRISTYSEVQLTNADGKVSIPDGAIVVEWGKKTWRALLEVKTGAAQLTDEQVSRYVDLARAQGFDAVVTLSNDLTVSPEESPVKITKAKLKRVDLRHLSWWGVITEAVVQHRHRGVSDPDQAWILGELITYLDDERSGASGFQDMGSEWVRVRDAAREQTLRAGDPETRSIAERWEQLLDYLALGLGQDLGREVVVMRRKSETKDERLAELVHGLAEHGILAGRLRVPDAIGPIAIAADLRSRRVTTSVHMAAPEDSRARGRIGWLLRQLKHAPQDLRVEAAFVRTSETSACLLSQAQEDPKALLSAKDPRREPRAFTLALSRPLGKKRGRGRGSFVGDTRQQTIDFYRQLVQDLRAWQPPAPKLPEEEGVVESEVPTPAPPPFTAPPAVREPGEGTPVDRASD
jgi:hypothetical protein